MGLGDRMEELGETLGAQEAGHRAALDTARQKAEALRALAA